MLRYFAAELYPKFGRTFTYLVGHVASNCLWRLEQVENSRS